MLTISGHNQKWKTIVITKLTEIQPNFSGRVPLAVLLFSKVLCSFAVLTLIPKTNVSISKMQQTTALVNGK